MIPSLRAKKDGSPEDAATTDDSSAPLSWIFGLVVPLWLVYISNQWSRSSLYYLVDFSNDAEPLRAMNVDIGFSEAQYGVLASLAFTSLFAVASLAAGIISDRFNRKTLTIGAAVVWSMATLGTSLSHDYPEVVLWRVCMGLACAFVTPPAYTLIAQRVPKESVSLASSLYGTGVALGGAFASLSILLDTSVGWRNALVIIAFYGFAVAIVASLLLPNDPKEKTAVDDAALLSDAKADLSIATTTSDIFADVEEAISSSRVKWLFMASFLRFCSGLCIGVWSAPYFRMVFPDQQSEYAVAQALITAVGGSVSGLLGGYIADSISAKAQNSQGDAADVNGLKLWIPVVGSILAAPAWYLAVEHSESFEVAMTWLAAEYFVAECWFGPTISVLQKTVGPKIGGTSQGLFTLTGAVANVAPSILGFLYGQASGQESSTELAGLLVSGVCFGYVSSAFCFAMSALSEPPPAYSISAKDTKSQ
jgi:MFS family permease